MYLLSTLLLPLGSGTCFLCILAPCWKGFLKSWASFSALIPSFPTPEDCCSLGKQEGILVLLFLRDCVALSFLSGCPWLLLVDLCCSPHLSWLVLMCPGDLWEHMERNLEPWAEMMLCLWSTDSAGSESRASSSCRGCAPQGPLFPFVPPGGWLTLLPRAELTQELNKGDSHPWAALLQTLCRSWPWGPSPDCLKVMVSSWSLAAA